MSEPVSNVPKEKISTGKGTRAPVARGSVEAKTAIKSNRANRAMPKDWAPTEKSLTRVQKAVNAAKPVAKTAIKVSSAALKGATGLLQFMGKFALSVPGLNTLLAGGFAYLQIQEAIDAHKAGEITEEEMRIKIVRAVGGAVGAVAGGTAGALIGSIGGPVGSVLGGIAGGLYVGALGEDAAEALYKFFTTSPEKTIKEQEAAIENLPKIRQTNTEVVKGGEGAAFSAMHGTRNTKNEPTTKTTEPEWSKDVRGWAKDYKEKLKGSAGKGRGYSPNAQPVPKQMSVPDLKTPETSSQQNASQVAVNNTTNTIGGTQPKIVSTTTASVRNRDVDRYLKNQSVPV
jgi:hypothetical protein